MTHTLRPLSLGELLDRTFQLYRRHFMIFVGIAALPQLVVLVYQIWMAPHPSATPPSLDVVLATVVQLFGFLLLTLFIVSMQTGATVIAVSNLHLDRPVTIGGAYRTIAGRVFAIVLLTIAVAVLVGLGLLLCIVPGVYLALRWALAVPVAVLESANFGDAMSRSWALTKDDAGRLFMVYFLFFVLTLVTGGLLQVGIFAVVATHGGSPLAPPHWAQVVQAVGAFFTGCLVGPLLTIALSLVYYDERVRKEAFDMEHMMAEIDRTAPDPTITA